MGGYGSGCSRPYGSAIACGTEDAASANLRVTRGRGPTRPISVGADAGDAAADDRGVRERQVVAHLDDLLGGTDDLFRERPDARHLVDRLAVQRDAGRPVMHAPARRVVVSDAQHGLAGRAVAAAAAMRTEREDNVVAGPDIIDIRAVLDDDAGGLVPSTIGSGNGQSPFMMCQSLMQTPAALTRTRTSLDLGGPCSRSRICKGLLISVRTAARMSSSLGPDCSDRPAGSPSSACYGVRVHRTEGAGGVRQSRSDSPMGRILLD